MHTFSLVHVYTVVGVWTTGNRMHRKFGEIIVFRAERQNIRSPLVPICISTVPRPSTSAPPYFGMSAHLSAPAHLILARSTPISAPLSDAEEG